jgi:hypothetical protein
LSLKDKNQKNPPDQSQAATWLPFYPKASSLSADQSVTPLVGACGARASAGPMEACHASLRDQFQPIELFHHFPPTHHLQHHHYTTKITFNTHSTPNFFPIATSLTNGASQSNTNNEGVNFENM